MEIVDGLLEIAVKQFCVSDIFPETFPPKNMKTYLASRRSTPSHQHPVRHLAALALLCPGLLALSPSTSQGAAATPDGSTFTTATCSYVNGVKRWVYRVDPPEVESFQLTVTYDPLRARLNTTAGLLFKFPFVGNVVQNAGSLVISGALPQGQPTTPGDVDIFELIFDDLTPLLPIDNVTFTVGGAAGDFIQAHDVPTSPPPYTGAATGPVVRSVTPGILPFVWDPDGSINGTTGYNNGTTGGPGVWNTSATSFDGLPQPEILSGQIPMDVAWTNGTNLAVFGGNPGAGPGAGVVTVSNGISAGGLQFDMPGYHLSGGSLTLATPQNSAPTIEVRAGAVTLSTPLAGSAGFKKTGPGTLILDGTNSLAGTAVVNGGSVALAAANALGAISVVKLNSGGKLELMGPLSADRIANTAVLSLAGGDLFAHSANETMQSIDLSADSAIHLQIDGVKGDLAFGDMTRTGGILTIYDWVGSAASSGLDDRLFIFGTLTPGILANIYFDGFAPGAIRLGSNEIVPAAVPEPGTSLLLTAALALGGARRLRPRRG